MDDLETTATVWIRPEDADHPKLDRLRRAVDALVSSEADVTHPWFAWGNGVSRAWLFEKLEAGAQVVIVPPWSEGGFAGLPSVRAVPPPSPPLSLQGQNYTVGAVFGIEPTPAWQEQGVFVGTRAAWLVAHEPFVGAGRAWLCTAELLMAGPTTRPREARRLTADLVAYVAESCKPEARSQPATTGVEPPGTLGFGCEEAPYLLAILGLPGPPDVDLTARFVHRRLGVEPDLPTVERLLALPEVQSELQQPIGKRALLAEAVDSFGLRSYRIEIEETAS